jgi:hypothetical protein
MPMINASEDKLAPTTDCMTNDHLEQNEGILYEAKY